MMLQHRPIPFPALPACSPTPPPTTFRDVLMDEAPTLMLGTALADSTAVGGVRIAEPVLLRLQHFVELLLAGNELMNLTALRTGEAVWTSLVLDALRMAPSFANLPADTRIADIGCGAGFPGIPLAILFPELRFTLIDATAKKVAFVTHACQQLELTNVNPVCGRAEQLAAGDGREGPGPLREQFDVVTARAVAPLPILLELTVPFARAPHTERPGGRLLLVKGEKAEAELAESTAAMQLLSLAHLDTRVTPSSRLLLFQKLRATTARYPRPNGAPKRNPL